MIHLRFHKHHIIFLAAVFVALAGLSACGGGGGGTTTTTTTGSSISGSGK